jgi:Subtilase family
MTRMMAVAALFLLLSAPAQAGTFSLVEARRAADPFLKLTGARELSAAIGLWRVQASELPSLRRARLVRLAEPERPLAPAAETVDPLVGDEWWLGPVGATQVVAPGPGVPVVVVDTGLDLTHPEFAQRPDTAALNTQNVVNTTSDFHGTAVASVVGAPANEVGMVGVYPQAALFAYDADLSGHLTLGELIAGIEAAAERGRVVINLSLGSTQFDPMLRDVVFSAFRRGALIVAAAGNTGANGNLLTYPANLPHVLTVAATDQSGGPAAFSSASRGVDLTAPGVGITTAVPLVYTANGYQRLDGTSFSAPIVSGAAALVWTLRTDLDNTQMFDLMRFSAHDISRPGFDTDTGYGILSIPGALAHQAPTRDFEEPNDDIRFVRPGGLFFSGTPPITSRTRNKASLHATLDANEDPVDLYRLWVPGRHKLTVTVRSAPSVHVRVWTPATRSIVESAAAARRDLAASAGSRVSVVNGSRRGGFYFVDVRLAHGVANGGYELSVATSGASTR